METMLTYLPLIDLVGLILSVLLVWQANRLHKQVQTYSKQNAVETQQMKQRLKQSERINP